MPISYPNRLRNIELQSITSNVVGNKGNRSVVDFRQFSDRPASQITSTEGEFVGFNGSDLDYRVEGGRLVCYTGNQSTFYCEVRLPDSVRHAWMILEFGSLASIPEGGGCLLGIARNPGWIGYSAGMVVHDYCSAKVAGLADNQWGAGTYPTEVGESTTLFNLPWGYPQTKGYTFPNRTVRFDVTFDPVTGRTIHYIDGYPVHTIVKASRIGAEANQVLIENVAPGVGVVEFGGSTNIPEDLFKHCYIGVLSRLPVNTHCNDAWQKLYTFKVLYPPSGIIEVSASPWFSNVGGLQGLLMNLGPTSGSAPDSNLAAPFRMVSMGVFGANETWSGAVNFRELRGGTPGTVEEVSIFMKGSTGIYHEVFNEGPTVRAIGHMRVDS